MGKIEEKSLWFNFFDLVGNSWIDREESEGILKDVTEIRDKYNCNNIIFMIF